MLANRAVRKAATVAALTTFCWSASNMPSYGEARSARRDPAAYAARKAQDPNVSAQDRQLLQRAASRLASRNASALSAPAASTASAQIVADLRAVADRLDALQGEAAGRSVQGASTDSGITQARRDLMRVQHEIVTEFAAVGSQLRLSGAGQIFRQRYATAKRAVRTALRATLADLQAAARATSQGGMQTALASAIDRLRSSTTARPAATFDPSRLPFRSPAGSTRPPRTTDAEFAAAAPLEALTARAAAPAAAGPGPGDLDADEDAQITPAIQSLAASLGNQPLAIFDWVRNNIEFVPTFGAVQGSEMTREAGRGNAFDIASLLVALLRAAGVGARYVVGTVEIPAATVVNWVGGAETPDVAQQILGQGSIPNVAITQGSTITRFRIEHVWVEAWIDYIPSRGAIQVVGDTWIPMDASLKQHTFTPDSGLLSALPLDTSGITSQMLASATIDPSTGSITNPDQEVIDPVYLNYLDQVQAYVTAHGLQGTPDQILGGPQIAPRTSEVFEGTLPYSVVAQGPSASTLPDSVRHYVTLNGDAFSYRLSLPALNSHRLGVQFDPATPADAAELDSVRQSGASSIPVYLINLMPVVKLDGVPMATGAVAGMGTTTSIDVVLESPDGTTTIPYDNVIVGDEAVFGVTGNGFAQGVVQARFANAPADNAPEYLHEIQMHYWMQSDFLDSLTASALGVHQMRLPSVGLFSSPLSVSYFFGSPQSGVYQSRFMDVKQSLVGVAGFDPAKVLQFRKQSGYLGSFMEGRAFDQFEHKAVPTGISSMHLLGDAAAAGIPLYEITSANAAAALPTLSLDSSVMNDITTAVANGMTVFTPQSNITLGHWSGVGYIIQDPNTGAGAYLISGGPNGGGLTDCLPDLVPIFVTILAIILIAALLAALLWWMVPALAGAGGLAGLLEGLAGFAFAFA